MQNKNLLRTIDVSHGTTHDGPGMRTTVFVKGCPLHCVWCQNPESISPHNEVWWSAADCIGCGSCREVCRSGAVSLEDTGIRILREVCQKCGACAEACPTTAMSLQGQEYDLEALLSEVLRDRSYYRQFGGGVTCSGGEPLLQVEFVSAFFKRLREEGITTALDTCGFAPRSHLDMVLPYTDYVLYDVKLLDSELHKAYTGAPNERILSNLRFVADYIRNIQPSMRMWIRTPLIPGITATEENVQSIGAFIRDHILDVIERWELCAFNGVCVSKYDKLGVTWPFEGQGAMTQSEIQRIREVACSTVPAHKVLITGMIRSD